MIDPTRLRAEIQSDPTDLGFAALVTSGDDAGIAALLNDRTRGGTVQLPTVDRNTFLRLTALTCFRIPALTDPVKKAGWANALSNIQAADAISVPAPDIQALLTAAVSDGVLVADEKAALNAAATRAGSRAEVLFGVGAVVGQTDVSFALRGDR